MGVYNNNKDGTRSTIANTIQVVDAPTEQFVSRDEFSAVVPNDTSADNKLVNDDKFNTKLNDIWKVQGELGAKNLIRYPYDSNENTVAGISWKPNEDGSITANGARTAYSYFDMVALDGSFPSVIPKYNNCIASVKNSADASSIFLLLRITRISDRKVIREQPTNSSRLITFTDEELDAIKSGVYKLIIRVFVANETPLDNVRIYPMLRYTEYVDDTWQPYAPTNYQLNQKLDTIAGVYLPNATKRSSKKVVASVGQTSVTFDATAFMTQYSVTASDLDLDISAKTSSGDIVSYNNVNITGGIVTVTFDALAEQTTFICKCSIIQ